MNIDWNYIIATALEQLFPIILTIIGVMLTMWLKKKTENEQIVNLVEEALYIINESVLSVNQTYVNALKAEGGFTKEKQEEAKKQCMEIVNKLLNDSMKFALEKTYGSLEQVLNVLIESYVLENKQK